MVKTTTKKTVYLSVCCSLRAVTSFSSLKEKRHHTFQAPIINTLNTVKESNGSDRPDQLYRDF